MSQVPAEEFVYEALPSTTSIRLIRLDDYVKRPQPHNTYIAITINVYDLTAAPPFDALSYTWGDATCAYFDGNLGSPTPKEQSHDVHCNGAVIKVQSNLWDAFEMLNTASISRTSYIWIDAICIDQKNLNERASQVQLMGTLYQSATSVIVWLGPEDTTISDAFIVAERLGSIGTIPTSKEQVKEVKTALEKIGLSVLKDRRSYASRLGIEPITDRQWLAWVSFLRRPYFERVWVIQEVSLARTVVAVCGRKILDWEKFSAALFFFMMSGWHLLHHTEMLNLSVADPSDRFGFEKLLASKMDSGTSAMQLVKTREFSKFGFFRFEQLLSIHRFCKATDPRDKIYSLLGFSNVDKPPFSDSRQAQYFCANYKLPVEVLYTRVTRILMESHGDLRLLNKRESNYERSIKKLPSWVPDFSVRHLPGDLCDNVNEEFRASGELKWQPDTRDYSNPLLNVQGYFLGTIVAHSIKPLGTLMTPLWGSICEVARGLSDYYSTTGDPDQTRTRAEVLARTCITNTLKSQTPAAADELLSQFTAHVATLCGTGYKWYGDEEKTRSTRSRLAGKMHRFMITYYGRSINEHRVTPWIRLFGEEPAGSVFNTEALVQAVSQIGEGVAYCDDYRLAANLTIGYRVVFRTSGGLLGVGPIDLKVGDEIWVLAGAITPVVLRRKEAGRNHHEYLGAAYVHGMMHGEVLSQDARTEDIILA